MPPSQLKRLKASLRAAGVIGTQKSKKEKKRNAKAGSDARVDKHVKLQSIREEFNPFEIKTTRVKHDVSGRTKVKGAQGRPGLSKQIGEETRKKTLLVEMQKKDKAGGIVDRRFGENDPTMPPEERMLERLTRERQGRLRNGEVFNLEDDDDATLTHFGQSLGGLTEFDEGDMLSDGGDDSGKILNGRKRGLDDEGGEDKSDAEGEPARKKSRAEVMKEVIAKSKFHKYERQKAKEEDEDIREELDAQMGDIWSLLTGAQKKPSQAPAKRIPGEDKEDEYLKYDTAVKEMIFDKRTKPADRTKTAEEKAQEEVERLKRLEEARLKRMRGEVDSDDNEGSKGPRNIEDGDEEKEDFGLGRGIPEAVLDAEKRPNPDELVDGDYEVDSDFEDLGSGAEHSDDYNSDVSEPLTGDSDDEEFLADVLPAKKANLQKKIIPNDSIEADAPKDGTLAYTYPCPSNHKEFLLILKDIPVEDLPTVIQRIRILYSPKLAEGNKEKLAIFSTVLLDHIMHVADTTSPIPFPVLETALRHLHALARSHALKVSEAFRAKLDALHQKSSGEVNAGDLIMLTAISTIYPASDHFHPVVTPANLVMAKYLAQSPPNSLEDMCIGTYIATLMIQGQRLSKRVIPEAINYILLSLTHLSPVPPTQPLAGSFPYHAPTKSLRITNSSVDWIPRKPGYGDMFSQTGKKDTGLTLMYTLLHLVTKLSDLWAGKNAFTEVFTPAKTIISHILATCNFSSTKKRIKSTSPLPSLPPSLTTFLQTTLTTLNSHLAHSHAILRPLELHHHRPLPIPSNYPKFHETYSLDKRSYDPDTERVALAKLKAEHKRTMKGALRELRKDSAFVARVKLREEKVASKEYHAKMKRLTEMIQHEEGQGKNEYERERRTRKKSK